MGGLAPAEGQPALFSCGCCVREIALTQFGNVLPFSSYSNISIGGQEQTRFRSP
jgi:hypothetical protein